MIKKTNIILQVVSWTESSVKLTTWKSKWFQYQIRITSKSSLTYRSQIVTVVVGILTNLKHSNLQNQIFESQKKMLESLVGSDILGISQHTYTERFLDWRTVVKPYH